jgi:hypothetical protein
MRNMVSPSSLQRQWAIFYLSDKVCNGAFRNQTNAKTMPDGRRERT